MNFVKIAKNCRLRHKYSTVVVVKILGQNLNYANRNDGDPLPEVLAQAIPGSGCIADLKKNRLINRFSEIGI